MSRRLLAVVVTGALALVGVSACRDLPTVAAYVGDARLTNAQVERMVHEFPEATRERSSGQIRQIAVSDFVAVELSRRIATEHGITIPTGDVSNYQNDLVPVNSAFIRLQADADAALQALQPLGSPQQPTEAEQREVYETVKEQAEAQGAQIAPFDQVKDLLDSPQMRTALAVRPLLRDALKKYDVVVNPRYQPVGVSVPFTLGQVSTKVVVPLVTNAPQAVTDVGGAPQP